MRLAALFEGMDASVSGDAEIADLVTDSRRVRPGALFIALRGTKVDGHGHIAAALAAGAVAVVVEAAAAAADLAVPHVHCPGIRDGLWRVAARFFGEPSRDLTVVGVTGTNGKTSTTYYLKGILEAAGRPTGLIGTIQYIIGERTIKAVNTTPDALELQRLFAEMRDAGMKAVVMEVSSHALVLKRTGGIHFDVAIFTNLTEDHLDFHKTMENYVAAKLSFLDSLKESEKKKLRVCCNSAIQFSDVVMPRIAASGIPSWTFGVDARADIAALDERATLDETSYQLRTPAGTVRIALSARGYFNIYNSLAAAAAALALDVPLDVIARGMADVRIPGRFELVPNDRGFLVAVDYAHTDDALRNLIQSARRLEPARVLTVFGCGGDRDRKKRPLMGRAASELSDAVFVTSDNPRGEKPEAIIADIMPGIADPARATVEIDRATAIGLAIRAARRGDIVLIAGKGHEDYQIFADRTIHFDDREAARAALEMP